MDHAYIVGGLRQSMPRLQPRAAEGSLGRCTAAWAGARGCTKPGCNAHVRAAVSTPWTTPKPWAVMGWDMNHALLQLQLLWSKLQFLETLLLKYNPKFIRWSKGVSAPVAPSDLAQSHSPSAQDGWVQSNACRYLCFQEAPQHCSYALVCC